MKVIVTKHALTSGVKIVEATESDYPGMATQSVGNRLIHFHKPDWHVNQASALAQVHKMRDAKVKSLKKALERIVIKHDRACIQIIDAHNLARH